MKPLAHSRDAALDTVPSSEGTRAAVPHAQAAEFMQLQEVIRKETACSCKKPTETHKTHFT